MSIKRFLEIIKQGELLNYSVIMFTGESSDQYPVLFFSKLLEQLRITYTMSIHRLVFESSDWPVLEAHIRTTFLGQKDLVWCGDISGLENNNFKKRMLGVLGDYTGPHTLFGFIAQADLPQEIVTREKSGDVLIISLQEVSFIEKEMLVLAALPAVQKKQFQELVLGQEKVSLDLLVLLAYYSVVMGKNKELFMSSWFEKIVRPESSLFTLAQYFFAYKIKSFWTMWFRIKDEYSEQFWVTFWAEQLWRAYYASLFLKQQNIMKAKQIAFRLPFSFLQKDWKLTEPEHLLRAHELLFDGDYRLKNGGSDLFLDLFYQSFLLKQIV